MKIPMTRMMLIAALIAPTTAVFADDEKISATKHPSAAYDQHKVKSHADDTAIYTQKMQETKAQLDQARRDLSQARSQNNPEVAKEAQERVQDLQKKYDKLAKKVANEKKDLSEAKQDLNEAQQDIQQDMNEKNAKSAY